MYSFVMQDEAKKKEPFIVQDVHCIVKHSIISKEILEQDTKWLISDQLQSCSTKLRIK